MSYQAILNETKNLSYEEQLSLISYLANLLKSKNEEKQAETKVNYKNLYPEGYFDLFGSIADETFVEPEDIVPQLNEDEIVWNIFLIQMS